jgi:hypothetical protein
MAVSLSFFLAGMLSSSRAVYHAGGGVSRESGQKKPIVASVG